MAVRRGLHPAPGPLAGATSPVPGAVRHVRLCFPRATSFEGDGRGGDPAGGSRNERKRGEAGPGKRHG